MAPDTCNLCGKHIEMFESQDDLLIHTTLGYGSNRDMDKIKLRFCYECFDKLIEGCEVSPLA